MRISDWSSDVCSSDLGVRCGFLVMLHLEIVQERLEREYDLDLVTTAPTVVYEVLMTDGTVLSLDNPAKLPAANKLAEIREPVILATILTPPDYVGNIDRKSTRLNSRH